ncbi:MAG: polyhydroxyalkanoate synthesis regulator [Candidatus Marinimicrobia bacterium]|nr:polyhydroxyalkanoate synthesis regulator [Candidatus Neomarinimicrobiota bacterium]
MLDIVKKTLLLGLGVASLTKEKAEEIVNELVKHGEVAYKDRPKVINELLQKSEEEKKKFVSKISETVKTVVNEMGLPSRDDIDELKKKINGLEKSIRKKKSQ